MFKTFGTLQKNITMTTFSSFQCKATMTREVREASLMANYQENLVSMVSRELCLGNVSRTKADLQFYREVLFNNNVCTCFPSVVSAFSCQFTYSSQYMVIYHEWAPIPWCPLKMESPSFLFFPLPPTWKNMKQYTFSNANFHHLSVSSLYNFKSTCALYFYVIRKIRFYMQGCI